MNKKVILTDCDGVLLDWEKEFHGWMKQHGYQLHNTGIYEMNEAYGIPKRECKRLIQEYNESAWMGFLPALRDARSGVAKLVENGYTFVVIADHGNADLAVNNDGTPHTAHSLNPVPCIAISSTPIQAFNNGILGDIAPTILNLLEIENPKEMTGKSLLII